MKIILKPLIWSLLFISICFTANAQSDTLRVGVAVEAASGAGIFGTGVNTDPGVPAVTAYHYGAGVSLHADFPLNRTFTVSASAGFNTFFTTGDVNGGQQVIYNTKPPQLETIPLKLGVKWFTGKVFYFQGEAGETLLANKSQLYGLYSYAFTFSPGIGLLVPLKKPHTYIDAGFRFESFASFYNDGAMNNFWGLHFAYMFNL